MLTLQFCLLTEFWIMFYTLLPHLIQILAEYWQIIIEIPINGL